MKHNMQTKQKTVRFTVVVQECGAPSQVTLWAADEPEPGFKSAVKKNRVMTIEKATEGTKRDAGVVGFDQRKGASYLIFPEPLDRFSGQKVIGIKYELIKAGTPVGPKVDPRIFRNQTNLRGRSKDGFETGTRISGMVEEAPGRPQMHKFRVVFRFT